MLPKKFTVIVYVNGSSSVVVNGGVDPLGVYLETREPSGEGYYATPAKRVTIDPSKLKEASPGKGADYEFLEPLPSDAF